MTTSVPPPAAATRRVLAIDPSLRGTGYAVLERAAQGRCRALAYGTVKNSDKLLPGGGRARAAHLRIRAAPREAGRRRPGRRGEGAGGLHGPGAGGWSHHRAGRRRGGRDGDRDDAFSKRERGAPWRRQTGAHLIVQ